MEQRSVVDYTLARRAVLADLRRRRVTTTDVCDANPYLLRAAKHYGEATDKSCPVCRRSPLVHVTYTFGDELGQSSGGARTSGELTEVAETLRRDPGLRGRGVPLLRVEPPDPVVRHRARPGSGTRPPRGPGTFRSLTGPC